MDSVSHIARVAATHCTLVAITLLAIAFLPLYTLEHTADMVVDSSCKFTCYFYHAKLETLSQAHTDVVISGPTACFDILTQQYSSICSTMITQSETVETYNFVVSIAILGIIGIALFTCILVGFLAYVPGTVLYADVIVKVSVTLHTLAAIAAVTVIHQINVAIDETRLQAINQVATNGPDVHIATYVIVAAPLGLLCINNMRF